MKLSQNYIKLVLGLKIKQLRIEKNLSLTHLAEKSGLSISYLNEIESGKKYPKSDKIAVIAKTLDVSYDKLVSLKLSKQLAPIGELFESNLLEQLPLDHYGIDIQKFVSLMSNASLQLSALVSTILEMAKSSEMSENNFSRTALRAYKEFNDNYFEELEEAVDVFVTENKLETTHPLLYPRLAKILTEKYFYQIDESTLNSYTELAQFRGFVKNGKVNTLFLNNKISDSQKAFIVCKELAYNHLNYKERSFSHSNLRLDNFDHLLNNFKASYFATALLIRKEFILPDLHTFFALPKWDGNYLISLIDKYNASPEMLFQRISNLGPKFLGLNKFFFLRFNAKGKNNAYQLSKEVRLNIRRNPGGFQSQEHYCRRWQSVKVLNELIDHQISDPSSKSTSSGILHSKFFNSNDEFLNISIAKQSQFISDEYYSVTIGFQFDDELKQKIAFWNDAAIPFETVNDTCEMCKIPDCKERSAPPTAIEKLEHAGKVEAILLKLNS
ncbi:MAG: helix-turn-helix domain-containing protein [Ignavibacteriaceae bacterium]